MAHLLPVQLLPVRPLQLGQQAGRAAGCWDRERRCLRRRGATSSCRRDPQPADAVSRLRSPGRGAVPQQKKTVVVARYRFCRSAFATLYWDDQLIFEYCSAFLLRPSCTTTNLAVRRRPDLRGLLATGSILWRVLSVSQRNLQGSSAA